MDSGYDTDKLANAGYTVTEGQAVHVPVIDQMRYFEEGLVSQLLNIA